MRRLRVLVACEMSGRVRDEFAARGWEAWSADLLSSESDPFATYFPDGGPLYSHPNTRTENAFHYQGDCRDLFTDTHPVNARRLREWEDTPGIPGLWDLVITHPPCDHLSLAGANRWAQKQADGRQYDAESFFWQMYHAPSEFVAVENPRGWIGAPSNPNCVRPSQVIQPWMFGDPAIKATCLWLKNLPELVPTHQESDYPGLFRMATGGGSYRTDKAAGKRLMNAYEDSEGRKNRAKVRSRTMQGIACAMASQWGSFLEEYYHGLQS